MSALVCFESPPFLRLTQCSQSGLFANFLVADALRFQVCSDVKPPPTVIAAVLALVGFAIAATWIDTIANQLVRERRQSCGILTTANKSVERRNNFDDNVGGSELIFNPIASGEHAWFLRHFAGHSPASAWINGPRLGQLDWRLLDKYGHGTQGEQPCPL